MALSRSDLKIKTMRGTGPGGQHKNKKDTACKITHIPTGITAYADERSQKVSKKTALADLEQKIADAKTAAKESAKKEARLHRIKNSKTIRTYDFKKGTVKCHETGKTASLKQVLIKGDLDKIRRN